MSRERSYHSERGSAGTAAPFGARLSRSRGPVGRRGSSAFRSGKDPARAGGSTCLAGANPGVRWPPTATRRAGHLPDITDRSGLGSGAGSPGAIRGPRTEGLPDEHRRTEQRGGGLLPARPRVQLLLRRGRARRAAPPSCGTASRSGDKCVAVVDSTTPDDVSRIGRRRQSVSSGQLEFYGSDETYLRTGTFDPRN